MRVLAVEDHDPLNTAPDRAPVMARYRHDPLAEKSANCDPTGIWRPIRPLPPGDPRPECQRRAMRDEGVGALGPTHLPAGREVQVRVGVIGADVAGGELVVRSDERQYVAVDIPAATAARSCCGCAKRRR